mmetsp:Transcript_5557/g.15661  ORF Transcript_5557/g.15661 Transcript_5557/m.15661 type:complete len:214 (-) Transcript_5557:932-1573(-)
MDAQPQPADLAAQLAQQVGVAGAAPIAHRRVSAGGGKLALSGGVPLRAARRRLGESGQVAGPRLELHRDGGAGKGHRERVEQQGALLDLGLLLADAGGDRVGESVVPHDHGGGRGSLGQQLHKGAKLDTDAAAAAGGAKLLQHGGRLEEEYEQRREAGDCEGVQDAEGGRGGGLDALQRDGRRGARVRREGEPEVRKIGDGRRRRRGRGRVVD